MYRPRIADEILQTRLASKGAVLIEGAKWCGKTTTAKQAAKSILYMQDPAHRAQNLEMAQIQPSRLLQGKTPRLIDEWQLAPQLWDAVRFEVDERSQFAQFILTGSAVPADLEQISHTGTGRVARMLMRPMSLWESGDSTGEVSLKALFDNPDSVEGTADASLDDIAYLSCRGGWPAVIGASPSVALQQAFDYVDAVAEADISAADGVSRNPSLARHLMRSLARHTGSQASINTILSDITGAGHSASDATLYSYINALRQIFVVEDAESWNTNLRSRSTIRVSPTRYFTDPSITTAALGASPADLLNDLNTMGLVFENLCIRDLRIYVEAIQGKLYHYRDSRGLECDAVAHLRDGRYGLIEIKIGGDKRIEEGVETLQRLARDIDTTKQPAPSFMMVLTAVGQYAYRRRDGVCVVPITCLRD